jgi:hypothetical protein
MYIDIHVKYRHTCQILIKLEFLDTLSKNTQISNFMKICRVGAELFHADGRMVRHEEANGRFPQFAKEPKTSLAPRSWGPQPGRYTDWVTSGRKYHIFAYYRQNNLEGNANYLNYRASCLA